jgi:hypothetical protein
MTHYLFGSDINLWIFWNERRHVLTSSWRVPLMKQEETRTHLKLKSALNETRGDTYSPQAEECP